MCVYEFWFANVLSQFYSYFSYHVFCPSFYRFVVLYFIASFCSIISLVDRRHLLQQTLLKVNLSESIQQLIKWQFILFLHLNPQIIIAFTFTHKGDCMQQGCGKLFIFIPWWSSKDLMFGLQQIYQLSTGEGGYGTIFIKYTILPNQCTSLNNQSSAPFRLPNSTMTMFVFSVLHINASP